MRVESAPPQVASIAYNLTTGALAGPEEYLKMTKVATVQDGSFREVDKPNRLAEGIDFGDRITWGGIMSSYFLAATMPADQSMVMRAVYQDELFNILMERGSVTLGYGLAYETVNSHYFGPKRAESLAAAPVDLSAAMDYGWFGWLVAPLLAMLKWLYSFTGNWGVAIILLTVIIKILFWPLAYKSYKSMENMKKIQPLMMKIRDRYSDDKQRQNQEMMQLYKTYKVNPMGGCLPIVVQLPVFFALYKALLSSIDLRQASFIEYLPLTNIVWLADLSLKDPLYITPIIMGLTMFLQQKMIPTTVDPTQAKVMLLLPVVLTFLFVNFPSGLVVYWLFNNIISILQQQGQMYYSARKKS
jgi:YidC/Oxa1 family membrane protein insertase